MSTVDLDILFEKPEEKVKLTSKDGQEFTLNLIVTTEIALLSVQQLNDEKSNIEKAAVMVGSLIENQIGKKFDYKWVIENIDWKKILYIGERISRELINSMDIINSDNKESGGSKKK